MGQALRTGEIIKGIYVEDFEIVGHFLAAEEKAEALNFEIEITHSGFEIQDTEGNILHVAISIEGLLSFLDGVIYQKDHPKT